MNASTNEVTVACGQYRSYPDALTHPSADAPADVRLPAGRFGAIASFRCDRATRRQAGLLLTQRTPAQTRPPGRVTTTQPIEAPSNRRSSNTCSKLA